MTARPPYAITCGQTISEDTTLQEDLVCPGDAPLALEFGASSIILDLGGHSIVGQTAIGDNYAYGVVATDKEGITIRNGTIEGFDEAVYVTRSHRSVIANMTFRDPRVIAVSANLSDDVLIEDSLFDLPISDIPVVEVGGIGVSGGSAHINNIEVRDGTIGIAFGFTNVCDTAQSPSNGEVLNSTFTKVNFAGIYLNCSTNVRIANNQISGMIEGAGVDADAPFFGAITGLLIENNTIQDGTTGVVFSGATDSVITNNTVTDNQNWGIFMESSEGCRVPAPGWDCFYTTGNLVRGNTTSGNTPDLMHDTGSTGNTWVNNSCITKDGADIPEC